MSSQSSSNSNSIEISTNRFDNDANASLAVSFGANVKVIQRQLGHHSAAITLDVYADLFDTDMDSVAQAFDSERAQNVPKPGLRVVENGR